MIENMQQQSSSEEVDQLSSFDSLNPAELELKSATQIEQVNQIGIGQIQAQQQIIESIDGQKQAANDLGKAVQQMKISLDQKEEKVGQGFMKKYIAKQIML